MVGACALVGATLFLGGAAWAAGPISIEMKAVGPYADPHNIEANAGDTLQIGYYVTEPVQEFHSFQTDISTTAGGAFLGVTRGDWFSGGGTYDSVVGEASSGPPDYYYRIFGYCFASPVSIDGSGDLAIISYRYDGPGTVALDAGAGHTVFGDVNANPFEPISGNVVVTISPAAAHPCACYDVNGDQQINFVDVGPFSAAYGSSSGDPLYNPDMDANDDGKVDWLDVGPFSSCYGASW